MRAPFRSVLAATAIGLSVLVAACGKKPAADLSEAAAFMAENARKPGVKSLANGLQYEVVRAGPAGGARPDGNDEVKVHYEGRLVDGTIFDSSYEQGAPATFVLDGLIPAWEQAIPQMRVGDEWVLYVPPEMGYGADGAGPIPGGAVLIFKIELLDVMARPGAPRPAEG